MQSAWEVDSRDAGSYGMRMSHLDVQVCSPTEGSSQLFRMRWEEHFHGWALPQAQTMGVGGGIRPWLSQVADLICYWSRG